MSPRAGGDALVESLGLRISKSEVPRIAGLLDEQVQAFMERLLESPRRAVEALHRALCLGLVELERLGCSPVGATLQVRLMARVSSRLQAEGLVPGGLSEEVLDRFLAERREAGYRDYVTPRALASLLAYLRGLGVVPPASSSRLSTRSQSHWSARFRLRRRDVVAAARAQGREVAGLILEDLACRGRQGSPQRAAPVARRCRRGNQRLSA